MRRELPQRARLAVEETGVRVETIGKRGREARIEEAPLGKDDLEQVVEALVEQDGGVERHDHVYAEEQLAEALVDVEVDRPLGLLIGAGPVEDGNVAAPRRW